jgi:MoaA/NifB/PqqE/SkfB family radical SAM enzyme
MPNLLLTNQCFNGCSFCFVGAKESELFLRLENIATLLPFIHSFGRDTVNLLGGEPTLNPDFGPILERLLQEGFQVKIFTHGKIPAELVARLQGLHDGEFSFCVNRSDGRLTPKIINFYRKLGYRIQIAATVFKLQQSLTHIIDEILTYHLDRYFRLGLAMPIWPDRQNAYLPPEAYSRAADELFAFIDEAVVAGLKPSFDCGFPYCFFNEEQKAYLTENEIAFASNCGIIPDVGPEFSAKPCFPLANFAQPLAAASSWPILRQKFEEALNRANTEFLFAACKDCEAWRKKQCCGGCMALTMARR